MKLLPREAELYRRCDEVLHYLWDPIGVAGEPAARDEYVAYLPDVFRLVKDDAPPDQVRTYLRRVETERMGIKDGEKRCEAATAVLRRWRAWIWSNVEV